MGLSEHFFISPSPGVLQSDDAALRYLGSSRHGCASPGGDEESWSTSERHHLWILQQGHTLTFTLLKHCVAQSTELQP